MKIFLDLCCDIRYNFIIKFLDTADVIERWRSTEAVLLQAVSLLFLSCEWKATAFQLWPSEEI